MTKFYFHVQGTNHSAPRRLEPRLKLSGLRAAPAGAQIKKTQATRVPRTSARGQPEVVIRVLHLFHILFLCTVNKHTVQRRAGWSPIRAPAGADT